MHFRKKYKKPILLSLIFAAAILVYALRFSKPHNVAEIKISGQTMGTTYSIVILNKENLFVPTENEIEKIVNDRLKAINQIFSTYIPTSTISQFNQNFSTDPMLVEESMIHVVKTAQAIEKLSQGAFNIGLDPLIDLWGFDKSGRIEKKPKSEQIKKALKISRSSNIEIVDGKLRKIIANASINLSGIAKGYGVDELARLIKDLGFKNYLVEIGGEFVALGSNRKNKPWLIGIEHPGFVGQDEKFINKINLSKKALASSGSYLNFFQDDQMFYSHIIDPRTGYPVKKDLVSVSIIANDCMTADAWATAAMVMGEKDAKKFIDSSSDLGAIFVRKDKDGFIISYAGSAKSLIYK